MNKKFVGSVTETEKQEIENLYNRKNSLAEMIMLIDLKEYKNDAIYERILEDMTVTSKKYSQWWQKKSEKYNWHKFEKGSWTLDFDTNKVYLNL
jgi:CXXX repeat modification system protein